MHGSVFSEAGILGVLYHREIEFSPEAQSGAHRLVFKDGLAVIGDGYGSGALQSGEIGEFCATGAASGGGDGEHVHDGSAFGIPQPCNPFGGVDHGCGVGHGADGGEASSGGSRGAAGNGFFVTLSGLAEVHVKIDESGSNDQAARVELLARAAANSVGQGDLGDTAVAQKNVHGCIDLCGGIDEMAAFDQKRSFCFIVGHFESVLAKRPRKDCHTHGNAVANLVYDRGLRTVDHFRG